VAIPLLCSYAPESFDLRVNDMLGRFEGPDRTVVTTRESWISQVGNSLIGALIGVAVVIAGIVMLAWNEGRAVAAASALATAASTVITVPVATVDPANERKLVHVIGPADVAAPTRDPVLGISAPGTLRIHRTVEMYQWTEDKSSNQTRDFGGATQTETVYQYRTGWSERYVPSRDFRSPDNHRNPSMPMSSGDFANQAVRIGAFKLDGELLKELDAFEPLVPEVAPSGFRLINGSLFRGSDPLNPQVGDLRIHLYAVPAQTVSAIGQQLGGVLAPYVNADGYSVAMASAGSRTSEAMFAAAYQRESTLTWVLRGAGFIATLVGLLLLFNPLVQMVAVLPFMEPIMAAGVLFSALTLAIPVTLLTIAVAWLAFRPVLAVSLVLLGAGLTYGMARLSARR
jgi:uncharacterized membrane protein YkgB